MFLTQEQLADLTGYVQPKAQIRWLQQNGIVHWIRADGRPRVPVNQFDARPKSGSAKQPKQPDFDAVRVAH